MFDHAENPVVNSIKSGGRQFVEVEVVHGNASSPVPTKIKFTSTGTVDVRCEFDNIATATYKCW